MPRRIWGLNSNRVVTHRVLHAGVQSHQYPTLWAVAPRWAARMEAAVTVNQYQWPVPLSRGAALESLCTELLSLGAEYIPIDVLCLRQ